MAKEWFKDLVSPHVVDAIRLLEKAADVSWQPCDDGVVRPHFPHDRIARFYRWARTDDRHMGYAVKAIATWLVERPKDGPDVNDRLLESGLLRALVLVYLEHDVQVRKATEAQVAHAGDFIGRLAVHRDLRKFVMNWAVDSEARGDPTAIIRGVLLSSSFAEKGDARAFWDEAMGLGAKFPMRIFMDPCRAADGYFFTTYQIRCFSQHFRRMSETAKGYFGGYMAANALTARVFVSQEDDYGVVTRSEKVVPVKELARLSALSAIANGDPELLYIFLT